MRNRVYSKYESENSKLRPPLMRKPRSVNKHYFYCPHMLSANDDIPQGASVILTELPEIENDPFVKIRYNDQEIRVMWNDLRL